MKNKAEIKGSKNIIIQGTKDSGINLGNKGGAKTGNSNYAIIAIAIAAIGVIATIIIGWDNILNFFK